MQHGARIAAGLLGLLKEQKENIHICILPPSLWVLG